MRSRHFQMALARRVRVPGLRQPRPRYRRRARAYLCHDCLKQTSLKSGTIFARTLLPYVKWFQGMYLLTQSKNSVSTLELARQLGVRPDTAALMRHKLMSVMFEREASRKLDGRVEMDDAVLGGEKRAGWRQTWAFGPNKTPFVVAVETSDDGRPLRLLLHVVEGSRRRRDRVDGEGASGAPRRASSPDGLGCFRAVTKAGCTHAPVVAAQHGHSEKLPCFRWVNTVLGNVKTAIVGTLKSVAMRYVFRYLAEFQYRFNRRFQLPEMLARLASVATRAAPRPRNTLKIAHAVG